MTWDLGLSVREAVQSLHDLLPVDGEQIHHRGFYLARLSGSETYTVTGSGEEVSVAPSAAVHRAFTELRRVMYKPGLGSWFSVLMVVAADGHARTEFNYDQEPDIGVPAGGIAYLTDLHTYPIDEDKQPQWLKAKVAQGIADLHKYGEKSYPRWLKQMISEGNKPSWL